MLYEKSFMKVLMGTKTGKEQVKLTLTDSVVEELERLASKHGKKSPQEIIYELIEFYLPVWKTVDSNLKQAIGRQMKQTTQYVVAEVQDFDKGKAA